MVVVVEVGLWCHSFYLSMQEEDIDVCTPHESPSDTDRRVDDEAECEREREREMCWSCSYCD